MSGTEDPATEKDEDKAITSVEDGIKDEEQKESEALVGVIGAVEKEAEEGVKNEG